jgi:hypothetical protein
MDTVTATETWTQQGDVYTLWAEPPAARWVACPGQDTGLVAILHELDDTERETGRIAGVEIIGFSTFDCWSAIPDLPIRWRLDNGPPLPLTELLQGRQRQLRHSKVA